MAWTPPSSFMVEATPVPTLSATEFPRIPVSMSSNCFPFSLSSDLLMRDNLFEIITSSRTFYVQVKCSPCDNIFCANGGPNRLLPFPCFIFPFA